LELLRSKDDLTNWTALRYSSEIMSSLEMGRIEKAREWLDKAINTEQGGQPFHIIELQVLAAENNWSEVYIKTKERLSTTAPPLEREALAAWAAVAIVYVGKDIAEAETLCREAMSVTPWEPAAQTVRALVSLAQGKHDEAEVFLERARGAEFEWATEAAAAHIWAEIYRFKRDGLRQRRWQNRANAMDPAGAFRIPSRLGSPV
jgi:tetratricopeptide (TPR) repeat protein